MKITKQARREAKELFRACIAEGQLDADRVRQTTQRVIASKPRGYLAILTHFQRLVKLEVQRRTARVESAISLSAETQTQVQANLARIYGAGLSTTFTPNPELLGGLRIQVGSDVYDGSIHGRLAALRDKF